MHRIPYAAMLVLALAGCATTASGQDDGKFTAVPPQPVVVHRPPGVPADAKLPLFVVLGGYASVGRYVDANVHMNPIADKYGFEAAYPTSVTLFKGLNTWRDASWMPDYDIVQLRKEIRTLVRGGGVDPRRVFVVGTSIGGSMTYRVGCELSDQLAGIGAVSGAMFMSKGTCKPARPLSLLTIVGDKDGSLPLAGKPGIAAPYATSRRWAAIDNCGKPSAPQAAGTVTTTQWSGCDNRGKVALQVVAGGMHGWPGVRPYDAGDAFWQYFSSVRAPKPG